MLTILAIAIVSFTSISNRKKEEAYGLVKEQIMTAAQQYFSSNEYLFEGLSGDAFGTISLGKMVNDGYLNKVVDPRTGKSLSYCTVVEVKKTEGRYVTRFVEESTNAVGQDCDVSSTIMVSETGGPAIEVLTKGTKKDDDWYVTPVVIDVKGSTNNNGPITEMKKCYNAGNTSCTTFNGNPLSYTSVAGGGATYKETYSTDMDYHTYCYQLKNTNGKIARACTGAKIDKTPPKCTFAAADAADGSNGWYRKDKVNLKITGMSSDVKSWGWKTDQWDSSSKYSYANCPGGTCTISNISDLYISAEGQRTAQVYMTDEAGNRGSCSTNTIKIDRTPPTCSIAVSGTKGNKVGGVQWYIKNNATFTLNKAKKAGLSSITTYGLATSRKSTNKATTATMGNGGQATYYGYVKDEAGNEGECNSGAVGVETSVTLSFDAASTNNATSVNNRNNKVFNTTKSGVCGFGSCTNIKCRTDSGLGTVCPEAYFARACKNVGGYTRYFKVTSASAGSNVSVNDDGAVKQVETVSRYGCSKTDNYYYRGCETNANGRQIDVTGHNYQYTSPAGLTSNTVRLYVEYRANCGY